MQLLTNAYLSEEKVKKALTDPGIKYTVRFEVYDYSNNLIGILDTVTQANVSLSGEQDIKRQLNLTLAGLGSAPTLYPLSSRIKVYLGFYVENTVFELPLGVFLWSYPQKVLTTANKPTYTVTLQDANLYILSKSTTQGYTINTGTNFIQAITQILDSLNIAYNLPNTVETTPRLTFDSNSNYLSIINSLLASIGMYSCWSDGSGVLTSKSIPDFTFALPEYIYTTDNLSITESATFSTDMQNFANRVTVRSSNTQTAFPISSTVEALNSHSLSKSNIGFYIDQIIEDPNINSSTTAYTRAQAELSKALQVYQQIELSTRANPIHECFDIVGFSLAGDSDFSSLTIFEESGWTIELQQPFKMSHTLKRVS